MITGHRHHLPHHRLLPTFTSHRHALSRKIENRRTDLEDKVVPKEVGNDRIPSQEDLALLEVPPEDSRTPARPEVFQALAPDGLGTKAPTGPQTPALLTSDPRPTPERAQADSMVPRPPDQLTQLTSFNELELLDPSFNELELQTTSLKGQELNEHILAVGDMGLPSQGISSAFKEPPLHMEDQAVGSQGKEPFEKMLLFDSQVKE